MRHISTLTLLFCLGLFALSACSTESSESSESAAEDRLIGTWESQDDGWVYTFREDGTMQLFHDEMHAGEEAEPMEGYWKITHIEGDTITVLGAETSSELADGEEATLYFEDQDNLHLSTRDRKTHFRRQ